MNVGLDHPPDLPEWLAAQIPFRRYLVEVEPGLRMHVMEQGEGAPIVLFHGLPTWGYLYRKVAAELAGKRFRLIMPDMMGLGFSDRPAFHQHTVLNHSQWMANLLSHLELEDVTVVVQDWGGPVGLHALSRLPGTMAGLVVLNTVVTPPEPGFRPTAFHRFFTSALGALVTRYLGYPQRALSWAQGDRSSMRGETARAYLYPLRGREAAASVTAITRMNPESMEHPTVVALNQVREFVDAFDGPAAIVWGERDPLLGRLANRASRLLPQAEVTRTNAGHFLQEEVPEEIATAVEKVVSAVSE